MTYTVGNHGCDIRKDGEPLMAAKVLALLEQRDELLSVLKGIVRECHLPVVLEYMAEDAIGEGK